MARFSWPGVIPEHARAFNRTMPDIVFLFLVVLYAWVATKVREWVTISLLGFKLETPQLFLERPWVYGLVRALLFLVTTATAFAIASAPWYAGVALIVVVDVTASLVGRKKAYATFRKLHQYLAEHETDAEKKASLEAGARITDKELTARLNLLRAFGNVQLKP